VVMQGSLYQFLPDARPVVDRMLDAARHALVVAEPVDNVIGGPLSGLIARLGDPGTGPTPLRFDARGLDELFSAYGDRLQRAFPLPGSRERAYVVAGGPEFSRT
jgi:hypothetical protein